MSPSSRRAWIEISHWRKLPPSRAWIEISYVKMTLRWFAASPSSRRAWIEISLLYSTLLIVSPSPSSRRAWIEIGQSNPKCHRTSCRPPRGGCG